MSKVESPSIFIFAGEASGDLHGGSLIEGIKEYCPKAVFEGVGGTKMCSAGLKSLIEMDEFQVMGFTDVVFAFPRLYRHFYSLKNHILGKQPDCVVLIDYPGFNLRLAKKLRDEGYEGKIVQYISPTVWAHGSDRIQHLAKTVDLLLTIFPFEKKYYTETDLKVTYVGHPVVDYIKNYKSKKTWFEDLGLKSKDNIIGVFPGSRKSEIRHNLLNQLQAVQKLQTMHPDAEVVVSCANEGLLPLIQYKINKMQSQFSSPIVIAPPKYNYELMGDSRVAVAVSGTATMELALHETPTVVVYHVTLLNRLFAQYVLGLTMTRYCIVNIIAEKDVFPELIVDTFQLPKAYAHLERFYQEKGSYRKRCLSGCKKVADKLDGDGVHLKAAKGILRLLGMTFPTES